MTWCAWQTRLRRTSATTLRCTGGPKWPTHNIPTFWPPLMRRELLDNVHSGAFDPLVVAAAGLLAEVKPAQR